VNYNLEWREHSLLYLIPSDDGLGKMLK